MRVCTLVEMSRSEAAQLNVKAGDVMPVYIPMTNQSPYPAVMVGAMVVVQGPK